MEKRQQGFTLLEVMVALIVPAVLGTITLPLYQRYVAKTQVTAALADITPGNIGAEARIAAGAPSTDVPGDIALPPVTDRCRNIAVHVEAGTRGLSSVESSITCIMNGNAEVDGRFIRWFRLLDRSNATDYVAYGSFTFDDHKNLDKKKDESLYGKWFCVTNVDLELRPAGCVAEEQLPVKAAFARNA
ncbi:MAG TPA: pilin [Xylella fastidiosa subsp. pauca]